MTRAWTFDKGVKTRSCDLPRMQVKLKDGQTGRGPHELQT
jgi:hypothetical protein